MRSVEIKGEFVGGPINSRSRVFSGNTENSIEDQVINHPENVNASNNALVTETTMEIEVAEISKEK